MIIILLLIAVVFVICWFCFYIDTDGKNKDKKEAAKYIFGGGSVLGAVVSAVVVGFVFITFTAGSYSNYLNLRAFYDSTIEQYATAVEMYQDKAVIDIEKAAFTDLKYQGYQDNIHELIMDLRERIIRYNEDVISKRIMSKNPFFNWIIVNVDDDMKLMSMKTANTTTVKN